ncbi:MAG: zinc-ribbon domain-containing protein [Deltaproteobacteria bacterium]|nr:zinc-ribbon domain-containing protein [Deltaproteobacteria bacterium]
MIVACEQCQSRFRLDDSLLKDEGSKVRCSRCGHVFLVRPSRAEQPEPETVTPVEEAPEETVVLDSPPDLEAAAGKARFQEPPDSAGDEMVEWDEGPEEDDGLAFDGRDEEQVEDFDASEEIEALSPEDLPEFDETPAEVEVALERASGIEDRVTREDTEEKGREEDFPQPPEHAAQASESRRGSRLLGLIIGLVLAGVVAYAVLYILSPGLIPEALKLGKPAKEQVSVDPGVKRLSFADVKGAFVRTETGKQRFVIRGTVINNYPDGRRFIQVKASILDEKGRTVQSRKAYAGNIFSQDELVGEPMASLEKGMGRRAGDEQQNAAIVPGGRVPFMVVFQDLPGDISEFTVEAVGSSPAQRT